MMRIGASMVLLAGLWLAVGTLVGSTVQRLVSQELAGQGNTDAAVERLEFAQLVDSWHPGVLTQLASLRNADVAIDDYRRLAELSPNDARAWASVFAARAGQNLFDEETLNALQQASVLGPYEPQVLEIIIRNGGQQWALLGNPFRVLVVQAATRSLESRASFREREIEKLIQDLGLLHLACLPPGLENHRACLHQR